MAKTYNSNDLFDDLKNISPKESFSNVSFDRDPFNFDKELTQQDISCSIFNQNVSNLEANFTVNDCLSSINHTKNFDLTSYKTIKQNKSHTQIAWTKKSKKIEEDLIKKETKKQHKLEKQKLKQEEKEKKRLQKQLQRSCKQMANRSRQYQRSIPHHPYHTVRRPAFLYMKNNPKNNFYNNNSCDNSIVLQIPQQIFNYSTQVRMPLQQIQCQLNSDFVNPQIETQCNIDINALTRPEFPVQSQETFNKNDEDSLDLNELLNTTDLTQNFEEESSVKTDESCSFLDGIDLIDFGYIDDLLI